MKNQTSSNLFFAAIFTTLVIISQNYLVGLDFKFFRMTGLVILFLAVCFIFIPFFSLKKDGVPHKGDTYMQTTRVVTNGIYGIVRHPQYLGYMLLTLGFTLLTVHWITIFFALIAFFFYNRQIVFEEMELQEKYGQTYRDYCFMTPKLNFIFGWVVKFLNDK
ncbi:MAG: hypothetical protein CL609_03905 [Anaerolineaceae bacterium]|nr:hypothetical protein [Anaerolineaceae bacterium]